MKLGMRNFFRWFRTKPPTRIGSTSLESFKLAFSEVPQALYVITDKKRSVLIGSLVTFQATEGRRYVSFNLMPSRNNRDYEKDHHEFEIRALSGRAADPLSKGVKANELISDEKNFLWTMKARVMKHSFVFGKISVIAEVTSVERLKHNGIATVHQYGKFHTF